MFVISPLADPNLGVVPQPSTKLRSVQILPLSVNTLQFTVLSVTGPSQRSLDSNHTTADFERVLPRSADRPLLYRSGVTSWLLTLFLCVNFSPELGMDVTDFRILLLQGRYRLFYARVCRNVRFLNCELITLNSRPNRRA